MDMVLARAVGTDHWIPPDPGRQTEQVPGTLVYLLLAPLWFGNAQHIAQRIRTLVRDTTPPVHCLVLDAAGVSDIDFTGARILDGLVKELTAQGVTVGVARASGLVPHDLRHSDLLADIGRDHVFSDVESAVRGLHGVSSGPHAPGPDGTPRPH